VVLCAFFAVIVHLMCKILLLVAISRVWGFFIVIWTAAGVDEMWGLRRDVIG